MFAACRVQFYPILPLSSRFTCLALFRSGTMIIFKSKPTIIIEKIGSFPREVWSGPELSCKLEKIILVLLVKFSSRWLYHYLLWICLTNYYYNNYYFTLSFRYFLSSENIVFVLNYPTISINSYFLWVHV